VRRGRLPGNLLPGGIEMSPAVEVVKETVERLRAWP